MEPLSANDPRVVGEFALRARLGSGGMGRVYLGFSPGGRAVAIKVVHPELARDAEFLRRFRQEVASARAVSGMYTAAVVGSGVDDDPPWLATAYVPGPPLAEVVGRHGPLGEAAVWRLAAGLADALRAVHACGLVHRDLKPGNVLLAADGPHVIDFGISRAFEGTALTSAGMVVGTPGYMSPEQAEGQQAGPPSDVFSLGCVLAYAATGNAPFGGGSAASILYRVVTAEPDLGGVPGRLRQIIAACMSKDPAQRSELARLTAMISALGPPLPGTIGAFWPEPLAGLIAADQAPHPPTEVGGPVSPPAAGAGIGSPDVGGFGGATPVGRTRVGSPLEVGLPQGGLPQGGQGVGAADRFTPGPAPAATGHAPMVADGYLAAAQPQYGQPAAGQSWPPQYPGQPYPGQPYPGQQYPGQPYPGQQYPGQQHPSGQQPQAGAPGSVAPGSVAPGSAAAGNQYGTPSWLPSGGSDGSSGPTPAPATLQATSWASPQPSPGGSWPGGGQPSSGGASYTSAGTPLAQYAPARRRPTKAELPPPVLGASRLMYAGAVATALNILFGNLVKGRYDKTAVTYNAIAARLPGTVRGTHAAAVAKHASTMAADLSLVVGLGGILGVVCWLVIAAACRRGRGWTRTAGTVLLGLDTAGVLAILLGTHNDPTVHVTAVITWALGLAAAVLLWSRQARDFFAYHSR